MFQVDGEEDASCSLILLYALFINLFFKKGGQISPFNCVHQRKSTSGPSWYNSNLKSLRSDWTPAPLGRGEPRIPQKGLKYINFIFNI